ASGSTGTVARRALRQAGGTDLLLYNFYRDAGRLAVWGETAGVDTVTQNVTVPNKGVSTLTFTMYGRIEPLQNVHAGTYSDNLVITIAY
ncbi:MAG TPA: spore coat protein U domain-containing protein, partial [Usitatibacter sp.]|nr:spore coat protein U domain-containing protein [Usitatibacter sp.]